MKKLNTLSDGAATLHGVVALEGVPVAGEDRPAGGAAVVALEDAVQPAVDAGEGLAHEHVPEEFLRQIQGVGAAELQNGLRFGVHLKGHVKRAVDAGDGVICVGAGFADDIIVAAGRSGSVHGGSLSLTDFEGLCPAARQEKPIVLLYTVVWRKTAKKSRSSRALRQERK